MKTDEPVNKKIEETLNSFDNAERAEPRPYFFTRLLSAIEKDKHNKWELAGKFISRPAVVIAGLCTIIAINFLVIIDNKTSKNNTSSVQYTAGTSDELSGNIATIYDIETNN